MNCEYCWGMGWEWVPVHNPGARYDPLTSQWDDVPCSRCEGTGKNTDEKNDAEAERIVLEVELAMSELQRSGP